MVSIAAPSPFSTTTDAPSRLKTDLLLIPIFEADGLQDLDGLNEATGDEIERARSADEFRGRPYDTFVTPLLTGWGASRVLLIGAGPRASFNTERLRKVATAAALAARQRRARRVGFLVRGDNPPAAAVQAVAEGLVLAAFSGDRYKSGERSAPPLDEIIIAAPGAEPTTVDAAAHRGQILGESCNIARELSNEPSNVLTPTEFANRAAAIGKSSVSAWKSSTSTPSPALRWACSSASRGGAPSRRASSC